LSVFGAFFPVIKFMRVISQVLLLVSLTSTAAVAARPDNAGWAEGELIVKLRAGLSDARFEKMLRQSKGQAVKQLKQINTRVIKVAPQALDAVMRAMSNNPDVDYCEKNPLVPPSTFTPNDPRYRDQWHLSKIQASPAWDTSTGNGVTVAVLDAGVEGSHPDLANSMVPGWNVVSNNSDTSPVNLHGTAVAGAVAAIGDNGRGVASVAWRARIMPVRITNRDDGWANGSDMIDGILWAADHGAKVVNISYDIGGADAAINEAAQYLRSKGGVLVMSAGNSNTDNGYSDNPYIIDVAATTDTDARAGFSNYGNYIDIAAPGEHIVTTWENGGYGWGSGTSFSSPVVAGVVALIKAANPGLSVDEVETVLENSADDLGRSGWDKYYGHGRVNAAAAVLLATGGASPDTELPLVNIGSPANGEEVGGTVSVDVTAFDNESVARVELLVDGQRTGADSTKPYSFSWDSTGRANGAQVTLTARATDAAGNVRTASVTVTIAVEDTLAPVVTTPSAVTKEATGSLTNVNLGAASAMDDEDGVLAVTANFTGPFAVGRHTVVWSATDAAGNTGTANQRVTITDTTPPVVTPPRNITVQATGTLTSVNLGRGTAQDKVDGAVAAIPGNNGPFPVGITYVTWGATDSEANTGTATQTVTVTPADEITPDITSPVITVPADITVEATGPLTTVNAGQASAVDEVDGPVTVTASGRGPFAPGVHRIIWSARDQAGNRATAEQTITVRDTTRPAITIPGNVTVGATGYLTEVDLSDVKATDTVSGPITPVVDKKGPYTSGKHRLTWTATDAAGNRKSATQMLNVQPLVNLAANQTVSEGSAVTVDVFLSGVAPAYPVTIPYTVSGSATNPADHDVNNGVITINSGTTGKRVFNVVDDGFTGEGDETVVFELQAPSNAVLGARRKHTVALIEGNAPPLVDLEVEQQGVPARVVFTEEGLAMVIAHVRDPNPADRHSFDWSLTDNRLVDTGTGSEDTFSFDPQWLSEGVYAVNVRVTDNGVPAETVTVEVLISISLPEADTSSRNDQDGDGISDADEGKGDGDQDGVPDYLDAIDDPAILQSIEAVSDRALLVTEAGLGLRLGGTALAAGYYGAGITMLDIEMYAMQAGGGVSAGVSADSDLVYPGGLFDFEVTGLPESGQSVRVVIPQAAPIGADAVYRKYHLDSGWQDFFEDARNSVASAPGNPDSCPAPGAADYRPGLQAGYYCVQLTLEDGGPNDADGQRNGVVKDPGGVGAYPQAVADGSDVQVNSTSSGGDGGGGGCVAGIRGSVDPLLPLMVLLSVVGLVYRRRGYVSFL